MTVATRRLSIAASALVLVVAACSATGSSASPSAATGSVEPTASLPATTAPTPSVEPSTATPSIPAASPGASASSAACAGLPSTVQLPSDRLVEVTVSSGADADHLTFVFGDPSLPGPPAPPQGSLTVAKPPFTMAGSGAPVDMVGDHVVQLRFSNMSITNDAGEEVYQGPPELKPDLAALRHAVLYDASEGIVGWYVGYDGLGCVTLTVEGSNVVLSIAHA